MKVFNPKVSIIMPVYNGVKYLREAIDSAIAQTYQNIEIIVVNDGSTDETESMALSYGNKIKYFKKNNGGVASALNLGVRNMSGEYFSWLSHDDMYYPDKIEVQIKILAQVENKKIILYSDYDLIDEKSCIINKWQLDHEMLIEKPLYALFRYCVHGCTLLIPKQAFDDHGIFNENLITSQDYDLWFKMIRKINFVHIPQSLIKSRFHDEQGSKVNPNFIPEGNRLLFNFSEQINEQEILSCEKTKYLFYKKWADFLTDSIFQEGYFHILKLASINYDETIARLKKTTVSIIFQFAGRDFEFITKLLLQTHQSIELILLDFADEKDNQLQNILLNYGADFSKITIEKSLDRAIANAKGEFIYFLHPDFENFSYIDKIEATLTQLLLSGEKFFIGNNEIDTSKEIPEKNNLPTDILYLIISKSLLNDTSQVINAIFSLIHTKEEMEEYKKNYASLKKEFEIYKISHKPYYKIKNNKLMKYIYSKCPHFLRCKIKSIFEQVFAA